MFNFERAKAIIEDRGRTRRWVAKRCGIEFSTLKAYLAGARSPSLPVLMHMAQALECELSDLDDETGDRQASANI